MEIETAFGTITLNGKTYSTTWSSASPAKS